jgi:biopolymer transport protein ExbD
MIKGQTFLWSITSAEVMLTIYASEHAKYERVVDVLDALSPARITNVTFQAGAPE